MQCLSNVTFFSELLIRFIISLFQRGDDVLNGNDTDSACEEDILEDDIEEPESIIPQHVLDLADHALARLPPRFLIN